MKISELRDKDALKNIFRRCEELYKLNSPQFSPLCPNRIFEVVSFFKKHFLAVFCKVTRLNNLNVLWFKNHNTAITNSDFVDFEVVVNLIFSDLFGAVRKIHLELLSVVSF